MLPPRLPRCRCVRERQRPHRPDKSNDETVRIGNTWCRMGEPSSISSVSSITDVTSPSADSSVSTSREIMARRTLRDQGAGLVQQLFRLYKIAQLHAVDNMAVVQQIEQTAATARGVAAQVGTLSLLFSSSTVFVCGELLKASRAEYEAALELGAAIGAHGFSELQIHPDVTQGDVGAFVTTLLSAERSSATPERLRRPSPRIRLKRVSPARLSQDDRELSQEESALFERTHPRLSSCDRCSRTCPPDASNSRATPKRVAQRLVRLAEGDTPAFLGVTAMRNANHDAAGRAVNRAILAVTMCRQLTLDPALLSRIAMAALLFETGEPVVLASREGPMLVTDADLARMPAATAMCMTALSGLRAATVPRTVLAYEAQRQAQRHLIGTPYGGARHVSAASVVIATAHRFEELLRPDPAADRFGTPDEAVATLRDEARSELEGLVVDLLVGAVGAVSERHVRRAEHGRAWRRRFDAGTTLRTTCSPRCGWVVGAHGGPIARPADNRPTYRRAANDRLRRGRPPAKN